MAQNLPNPAPYAGGPPSLNEFQAGQGPVDKRHNAGTPIPLTGGGRDDPSQGTPYANESRVIATDEAGQGSYTDGGDNKEASGARLGSGSPQHAEGDGNIAPHGAN